MEAKALKEKNTRSIEQWLFEDIICRWESLVKIVTDNRALFNKAIKWLDVKDVQSGSGVIWSGAELLQKKGFDNKIGTTLASACVLCLDLLLHVWLHISGGLNCCQEFWRGMV